MNGITTFTLKMIAIITMLIDHVGAVLFPQYWILRVIGRMSYPIFAYTLVEGFFHTRDVKKYLTRLGIAALFSEIPFDLAFFGRPIEWGHQNVFFTLFFGVFLLYAVTNLQTNYEKIFCVIVIFVTCVFLRTDYSSMGLLMICCFYRFREQKLLRNLVIGVINVFLMGGLQMFATIALLPIALHNGQQGRKGKWFFYGFYPIHLLVIYFIAILLIMKRV